MKRKTINPVPDSLKDVIDEWGDLNDFHLLRKAAYKDKLNTVISDLLELSETQAGRCKQAILESVGNLILSEEFEDTYNNNTPTRTARDTSCLLYFALLHIGVNSEFTPNLGSATSLVAGLLFFTNPDQKYRRKAAEAIGILAYNQFIKDGRSYPEPKEWMEDSDGE